jgi:hypothetical protein
MKALPACDAERVNVFADVVAHFFFQHGVTGGSPQLPFRPLRDLRSKRYSVPLRGTALT